MSMWHGHTMAILNVNQKFINACNTTSNNGEKPFFFSIFAASYILPFTYLNTHYTL